MALRQNQIIPDTATGDRGYDYPNGEIPIGYGPHGEGLGSNPWDAQTGVQGHLGPYATETPSLHDLYAMNWLMASEDKQNANPNLKANPLYGYGNAPLEFDYSNYDTPLDVPEGQDAVAGYFEDRGLLDFLESGRSQADRDAIAQAFSLLRNAQEYELDNNIQTMLGDALPDLQKRANENRGLYGDMVVDLLQGTPRGRQIIDSIPAKDRMSRERNITGPGTGGFIK